MAGLAAKQSGALPEKTHAPTQTDFRRKIQAQYNEAMTQIDSALDLVIARTRAQIDGTGDPVSPTDILNLIETTVAV
jgi:hypothetical protein